MTSPVNKPPPPMYDEIDPNTGLPVTFKMGAVMDWLEWSPTEVFVWMNTLARMYREFGADKFAQKMIDHAVQIVDPETYT